MPIVMRYIIRLLLSFISNYQSIKGWGVIVKESKISNINCALHRNVLVTKSRINNDVNIYSNSKMEQYSYIAGDCYTNSVSIGKYCSIGLGLKVGLGLYPTNSKNWYISIEV